MWVNLIVASSNFVGLFGVSNYYHKELFLEAWSILFSVMSSFIYHLFENNKHNMPGTGYFKNPKTQQILLNIDRVGAFLAIGVTLKRMYETDISINIFLTRVLIAVIAELIPEIISGIYSSGNHQSIIPSSITKYLNPKGYKMNRTIELSIYVICHCLWHISVFQISNQVSLY